MDIITIMIYAVPTVVILAVHLIVAASIRYKNSFPISLIYLLGLTLLTTLIWYGISIPLAYASAECCAGLPHQPERYLFVWTIGLPLNICYTFPDLYNVIGKSACSILQYIFLPITLFLLGLILLIFVKPSVKRGEQLQTPNIQ